MLLYVHIPFCESKCPYCAFGSVTGAQNLAQDYFSAMINDFRAQTQNLDVLRGRISSVFFGGGTPSAISAKFYEPLFSEISPFLAIDCEITAEANPNSATLSWLKDMRNFGVNRISFGAQSFFDDKLKFLGRIHDARQIKKAVSNARAAGFSNINADLIYGTKLDTKKRLLEEVLNVRDLGVDHVSAYSLTLEKDTPFYGRQSLKKDSAVLAKFLIRELENAGFKQYEISNFGRICRHNLGYWQGKDYLALGAYAVGFRRNFRFYNAPNLERYIANPHEKKREILSADELNLEKIFLGARSVVGIEAKILTPSQLENARILESSGKLNFKDGRFFNENFLLADEIALFIAG